MLPIIQKPYLLRHIKNNFITEFIIMQNVELKAPYCDNYFANLYSRLLVCPFPEQVRNFFRQEVQRVEFFSEPGVCATRDLNLVKDVWYNIRSKTFGPFRLLEIFREKQIHSIRLIVQCNCYFVKVSCSRIVMFWNFYFCQKKFTILQIRSLVMLTINCRVLFTTIIDIVCY